MSDRQSDRPGSVVAALSPSPKGRRWPEGPDEGVGSLQKKKVQPHDQVGRPSSVRESVPPLPPDGTLSLWERADRSARLVDAALEMLDGASIDRLLPRGEGGRMPDEGVGPLQKKKVQPHDQVGRPSSVRESVPPLPRLLTCVPPARPGTLSHRAGGAPSARWERAERAADLGFMVSRDSAGGAP